MTLIGDGTGSAGLWRDNGVNEEVAKAANPAAKR